MCSIHTLHSQCVDGVDFAHRAAADVVRGVVTCAGAHTALCNTARAAARVDTLAQPVSTPPKPQQHKQHNTDTGTTTNNGSLCDEAMLAHTTPTQQPNMASASEKNQAWEPDADMIRKVCESLTKAEASGLVGQELEDLTSNSYDYLVYIMTLNDDTGHAFRDVWTPSCSALAPLMLKTYHRKRPFLQPSERTLQAAEQVFLSASSSPVQRAAVGSFISALWVAHGAIVAPWAAALIVRAIETPGDATKAAYKLASTMAEDTAGLLRPAAFWAQIVRFCLRDLSTDTDIPLTEAVLGCCKAIKLAQHDLNDELDEIFQLVINLPWDTEAMQRDGSQMATLYMEDRFDTLAPHLDFVAQKTIVVLAGTETANDGTLEASEFWLAWMDKAAAQPTAFNHENDPAVITKRTLQENYLEQLCPELLKLMQYEQMTILEMESRETRALERRRHGVKELREKDARAPAPAPAPPAGHCPCLPLFVVHPTTVATRPPRCASSGLALPRTRQPCMQHEQTWSPCCLKAGWPTMLPPAAS
eukprot:m.148920 g.148920  ORF g.148920 m.148920 type:complete len:531 (-) comp17333_c0_seq1:922-2514(-)